MRRLIVSQRDRERLNIEQHSATNANVNCQARNEVELFKDDSQDNRSRTNFYIDDESSKENNLEFRQKSTDTRIHRHYNRRSRKEEFKEHVHERHYK
jgi:hypothetical protein